MIIDTKYHGQINISQKDIWTFRQGLPGFAGEKQFTLLAFPDNGVFFVLQSTNTPSLGFIVANPFSFFPDYDIQLEDSAVAALQLEKAEQAAVYTILTVHDPFEQTTANLQAPVIVNTASNQAKQVILNDRRYQTRHPLFPAGAAKE
ncbi:flagellar assembly protein FliW [Bacillus xiapuensis]|uniref:flagellar assembly protein FliW n=1 Tax=Bacillus xiapuensis TaxID=2014075 RepID=UPI000C251177|nr:flagellar assembly protein FliW [Bacillus xiapuensis]